MPGPPPVPWTWQIRPVATIQAAQIGPGAERKPGLVRRASEHRRFPRSPRRSCPAAVPGPRAARGRAHWQAQWGVRASVPSCLNNQADNRLLTEPAMGSVGSVLGRGAGADPAP